MKKTLSTVHQGLSILIVIALLIEFFFAGMGVFHAATFQIHRVTGVLILAASALLLLIALLGRMSLKMIGLSVFLFVLLFVQSLLLQIHQPFIKALHPVNGTVILLTGLYLTRIGSRCANE
jgi:hypothetical protein